MGSAKDLKVLQEPTEKEMGKGIFEFADVYSVFDYGRMPDQIEGKGAAICAMTVYNFEKLAEHGIRSHLIDCPKDNQIKVYLVRKEGEGTNKMVPLEVIYRDVLGKESSVFRRLKNNEITYQDLGLDRYPEAGEKLSKPVIDYSTKYETIDRYFKNAEEAMNYAKLNKTQMDEVYDKAIKINAFLTKRSDQLGWLHIDGKVEFAFNPQGEIILVDAVGTLDEDRFEYKTLRLSKQIMRDYYSKTPWREELAKAQKDKVPKEQWPKPEHLPKDILDFVSNMYKAAANEWTGTSKFKAKTIEDLIAEDLEELKEKELV